jgi:hypothetical protein
MVDVDVKIDWKRLLMRARIDQGLEHALRDQWYRVNFPAVECPSCYYITSCFLDCVRVQRHPVDFPDDIEMAQTPMRVAVCLGELNSCVTIVT